MDPLHDQAERHDQGFYDQSNVQDVFNNGQNGFNPYYSTHQSSVFDPSWATSIAGSIDPRLQQTTYSPQPTYGQQQYTQQYFDNDASISYPDLGGQHLNTYNPYQNSFRPEQTIDPSAFRLGDTENFAGNSIEAQTISPSSLQRPEEWAQSNEPAQQQVS